MPFDKSQYIPKSKGKNVKYPYSDKCPIVLLLDTSGSMEDYGAIDQLNQGVREFLKTIQQDTTAKKVVEICVITFGYGPKVWSDFVTAEELERKLVDFVADGDTRMGHAISRAIDLIQDRKKFLRNQGLNYYRPWIVLITDGEPTDMEIGDALWDAVKSAIEDGERKKKFVFWAFGTENANFELLNELLPENRVYKVTNANFKSIFQWLSASMQVVSSSAPGDKVKVPNPSNFDDIELEL